MLKYSIWYALKDGKGGIVRARCCVSGKVGHRPCRNVKLRAGHLVYLIQLRLGECNRYG